MWSDPLHNDVWQASL